MQLQLNGVAQHLHRPRPGHALEFPAVVLRRYRDIDGRTSATVLSVVLNSLPHRESEIWPPNPTIRPSFEMDKHVIQGLGRGEHLRSASRKACPRERSIGG